MGDKKYLIEEETDLTMSDTQREARVNSLSLRTDNELFDDERYKPQMMVRVRFTSSTRKGTAWEVLLDKDVVLRIPVERLSKPERTFLSGNDGMSWLMTAGKEGIESVSELKRMLVLHLKEMEKAIKKSNIAVKKSLEAKMAAKILPIPQPKVIQKQKQKKKTKKK